MRLLYVIIVLFLMLGSACSSDGDSSTGDGSTLGDGDGDANTGDGDEPGDGDVGGDGDGDAPTCAETCPGCCDGEVCVETPTDAQCGRSGESCSSCESWQRCDSESGPSFGTCAADPTSTWIITVTEVTAYSQKEGPDDWDAFDAPDLMACLEIDGVEQGCTSECTDSYECALNQEVGTVTYEDVRTSSVVIHVYDADLDSNDSAGLVNLLTVDLEDGGFDVESPLDYGFKRLVVEARPE